MKVVNKVLLFVSCLIFLMSLSLLPLGDAVAKEKGEVPGKSPGPSERPPGWDKGEKKGWGSNEPPGLEGREKEEGGEQKGESGVEKKGKLEGGPSTSGPDEKKGKLKKEKKGKEGKKDKKDGDKGKPKKQKG